MLKNLLKNVQRPELDFSQLHKSFRPNNFLMAPKDYCPLPPDAESPVFDVSAAALAAAFDRTAMFEPRVETYRRVEIDGETQVDYVQYTKMGFPDTLTVRFIKLGEDRSTLAIYSRAHYGFRDFGVNKARVRDWTKKLTAALGVAA